MNFDPFGSESLKSAGESTFPDLFGSASSKTQEASFPDPFGCDSSKTQEETPLPDPFVGSSTKTEGGGIFPDPFGGDSSKVSGNVSFPDLFGGDSTKTTEDTPLADPFGGDSTKTTGDISLPDPFGGDSNKTTGDTSFPDPFEGDSNKTTGDASFPDLFGGDSNKTTGDASFPDPFGGDSNKTTGDTSFPDPFGGDSNKTTGDTSFPDPFEGDSNKTMGDTSFPDPFGGDPFGDTANGDTASKFKGGTSDSFGGDASKTAVEMSISDFGAFNFDGPSPVTVIHNVPSSKPDTDDVPPPLPPIRRKRSGVKQTAGIKQIGQDTTTSGTVQNPDTAFNEDPFSNTGNADLFAMEDPFANSTTATVSDPFTNIQNISTGGLDTQSDPFAGTDPFEHSKNDRVVGDTIVASGNSGEVMSDPFGGDDLFSTTTTENRQMSEVLALGRNLMSPSTDQEVSNVFANIIPQNNTDYNMNVSTSTTNLQNFSQPNFTPTAQPSILSTSSEITGTVSFTGKTHDAESPDSTYEIISSPPLPSVSKIPPRPPKPPRQPKTVHFEPEAIYEDLPNEFWTQELGTSNENGGGASMEEKFDQIKGEVDISKSFGGGEPPLSSSTPHELMEDPFGGDYFASTTDEQTKTGEETYDDASVGGFVADFGSMTSPSSDAVNNPVQYGNVDAMSSTTSPEIVENPFPESSYENTGDNVPTSVSLPKQASSGKSKKKGISWVNKYMKKITSSSSKEPKDAPAPKEPKPEPAPKEPDVPDQGLYEEPVKTDNKKPNLDNALTSSSQPPTTEQDESELYEEINVRSPTGSGVAGITPASNVSGSLGTAQTTSIAPSVIPEPAPAASTTQTSKSGSLPLKKPEIASVIASYTATGPEQLSLQPGQLIQVRKKSPSGWWEGELQARGQKRKIGWFPANYVKLLGASSKPSTPDTSLQTQSGSSSPATMINRTNTPTIPPPQLASQPAQPEVKYIDQVVALYPYTAQNDDELTFHNGSVINVISKDDANWWSGECNGQTGMFPVNYVDALTTSPPQEPTWSSDPAVLAETSAQESKRQNYIHELINTEITYMDDMSVVLDVFHKPLLEGKGMTEEELATIFVNWKELIVCNTKLSKAMKVRRKRCGKGQVIGVIGDILCENLPHLTPYIRFCSCQLNAAALLQHKTENSPEFKELHKKCVTDPRTKGMPLSSFLLKPMQRITKYPLMIGKILQYTPVGHPDHQNLMDALSKAEELCSQVNEGVRERENSDRLEWIFSHVQCDGLPEKITFNSVTNCLGPRKLLYSGTLYKNKSNKELVGFLFNDFLLLTVPLTSSTSVFVFDPKAKAQYKMYKSPIFLNEVMLKKTTEEDSETCQFQLSHVDRVFNLRATNQTERDAWCKNIEAASRHYLETEKRKREKTHQLRHTGGVGRLLVLILEACHLQPSDDNGKSDPFCEVSMGVQEHKTKVINSTLNPKWNQSMQFTIRDVQQDVLCITVFDRDLFSPNDFLGRTEICVKEIMDENKTTKGPITKRLLLHEVSSGEVLVKLDLQLYDKDT
ncbi:uncharacterized protein [Argopecten irradians]|uniref:uncharacterized protein isoform X6 n=1 Tax=Argopecten irradians TaxID=31199 RepID=UPI00371E9B2B